MPKLGSNRDSKRIDKHGLKNRRGTTNSRKAKWHASSSGRCSRKHKYETEAEAQKSLDAMLSRYVYIEGEGVKGKPSVYHCSRCSYFHWGHKR